MAVREIRLETLDSIFSHFADETNGLAGDPASFGAKLEAALHKHKVHYGANSWSWTKFIVGLVSTVFASDVAAKNSVTQAFLAMTSYQVWFVAIAGREQQMKIFLFQKGRRLEYIDAASLNNLKAVVENNGFPAAMVDDAVKRVGFVTLVQPEQGSWYTHYNENNENVQVQALIRNSPFSVSTSQGSVRSEKVFEPIIGPKFYPLTNINENGIRLNKIFSPMASSDFEPTRRSSTAPLVPRFFRESLDFCLMNSGLLNVRFENRMSINSIYFFVKGATMNFESTFQLDVISRYGGDGSVIDLTIMPKINTGHFVSKATPTILTLLKEEEYFVADINNLRLNALLPAQIQTESPNYVYLESFIETSSLRYRSQVLVDNTHRHNNRLERFSLFDTLWRPNLAENFKISFLYNEIMKSIYLGYKDSLPYHMFGHLLGTQLQSGVGIHKFVYQNLDVARFLHTFVCRMGETAIVLNLVHHQMDSQTSKTALTDLPIASSLRPYLTEIGIRTINVYNVELGAHLSMPLVRNHDNSLVHDVRFAQPNRGWGANIIYYKQPFYYNPDYPLEGIVSGVHQVRVSEMGFVADSHLGGYLQRVETMNSRFSTFWFEHIHTDHEMVINHMISQASKCKLMLNIDSVRANVMFAAVLSCGVPVFRISDRENFWVTGIILQSSSRPFSYNIVYTRSTQPIGNSVRNQFLTAFRQLLKNVGSRRTSSSLHFAMLQHMDDERHPQYTVCVLPP